MKDLKVPGVADMNVEELASSGESGGSGAEMFVLLGSSSTTSIGLSYYSL